MGARDRPPRQPRLPDGPAARRVCRAGRHRRAPRLRRRRRVQRPALSAGLAAVARDRAGDAEDGPGASGGEPLHLSPREHRRLRGADRRGLRRSRLSRPGPGGLARLRRSRAGAAGAGASRGLRVRAPSPAPRARAVPGRDLPARRRRLPALGRRAARAAVPARHLGPGHDPRVHRPDRGGEGRRHREPSTWSRGTSRRSPPPPRAPGARATTSGSRSAASRSWTATAAPPATSPAGRPSSTWP